MSEEVHAARPAAERDADEAMALDAEAAPQILAAQEQKRVELCRRAIEEALRRHRCVVLPEVTIRGGKVRAAVGIVPEVRGACACPPSALE